MPVKLYNYSLQKGTTVLADPKVLTLFRDKDFEDGPGDDVRRLAYVKELLPGTWTESHEIYATCNCRIPFIYDKAYKTFDECVNAPQEVKDYFNSS